MKLWIGPLQSSATGLQAALSMLRNDDDIRAMPRLWMLGTSQEISREAHVSFRQTASLSEIGPFHEPEDRVARTNALDDGAV